MGERGGFLRCSGGIWESLNHSTVGEKGQARQNKELIQRVRDSTTTLYKVVQLSSNK